jgi:hypothetical protein
MLPPEILKELNRPVPMKTIIKHLSLCLYAVLFLLSGCNIHTEENESEKEEGLPGVFNAMNEWSAARTYPNKKMIAHSYDESFLQRRRMDGIQKLGRSSQATTLNSWSALGPMNFAGRVISLAFHPTNPLIMWAGSASGGLWKTTNGGTGAANGINWTYVPTGFSVLGVGAIAINPTNPNIMYVGTGEVYDNGSGGAGGANVTSAGYIRTFRGSYGVGILKSTNGGSTWTKTLDFAYSGLKGVWDILIDPTNTDIVYAATTDGVYRTLNAGTTWTLIHNVVMASDICFKPGNYSVMYVGCGNFGSPGYGIYKSANVNAATPTFSKLAGGLPTGLISGKIQLAVSANAPSRVYASIGKAPGTSDIFALYSSLDDGATWTQKATASSFTGSALNQGWYAHDVAVSPTRADSVYWAEMELFVSTNGGTSFGTKKSVWSGWNVNQTTVGTTAEGTTTYVHADIHHVYVSPFDTKTIFCITDGGLFKSTNSGNNWISINGGLQTVQIYPNMAISGSDPNFMIGGMQDNEGLIYAGATGCKRIGNLGDGFHMVIHPTNDNILYASSYYFNFKRSTDKGVSWGTNLYTNSGIPPAENACFNAPLIMAPSTPTVMYGGTVYFKKSTSSGNAGSWSNMNGGSPIVNASSPILYMAVAKNDANLVYFSTTPGGGARSRLFKTTNGGTSFTEITGTLPDRYYSDIAIDPANKNRIAVSLSGFGSSHVYLSNDGGSNWTNIGINLMDVPANTLMFDPNESGILYVGNDIGVFATNNLPLTGTPTSTANMWLSYNDGFNDAVMVSDLLSTPGATPRLRIATYGRGIWQNDLLQNAAFATLPVSMRSFTGKNNGTINNLEWNVTAGSVVKQYEVEYSTDGVKFNKAGEVKAAGSNVYAYTHQVNTNATSVYYRLKIVNIDGGYEYSEVIEIQQAINKEKIYVYPNPVKESYKIRLPVGLNEVYQVKVIDKNGRLVKLDKVTSTGDISLDARMLATGTYHVTVESKSVQWNGSLLKL